MRKPFCLATILLETVIAVAQSTHPLLPASKPHRASSIYSTTPARSVTDWSLSYADRITSVELRQDLSVLAADSYEGRSTGEPGQHQAATYLAHAFAGAGLSGPVPHSDNPYFQHFTLEHVGVDPASSIKIGNRTFVVNRDFYVALRNPATATAVIQTQFVGYGISTAGYADFVPGSSALKQQGLVLLLGEPRNQAGRPLLGTATQPSPYSKAGFPEMMARGPALISLAPRATFRIAHSAAAFAQVPQNYPGIFDAPAQIAPPDAPAGQGLNLFVVSPEMGAALLGTSATGLAQYEEAVAAAAGPIASPFKPVSVELQVREKREPFTTENVLGYLEGSDKKSEVVVVSAHYDHVGIQNGVVYNGADDDGSGTVSMLAMARAFAQAKREGHGPRRSLLFLANVGEEIGLLGSRYYTDHPVFPMAATVVDLHMDMIGRVDSMHQGKGDYLYLIGDDWLSTELHGISEATNRQQHPLQLDYNYNTLADPTHVYYRSDHYNFAKHQVPVIYYFSGFHPDYHQPTDDVTKIDFAALTRRSQLIFRTAWAVANRSQRLRLDQEHQATGFQPMAAELDRYAGKYVSTQVPLTITLARVGESLEMQPAQQYPFTLEPVSPGVFKVDQVGIRLEFDSTKPYFTLRQGGHLWVFTKS